MNESMLRDNIVLGVGANYKVLMQEQLNVSTIPRGPKEFMRDLLQFRLR